MKKKTRSLIEALEARIAPATITVSAGILTYTDSTGVANSIALSTSGANYSIGDSGEFITLGAGTAGLGFTGAGTNTVTVPNASISSFVFNLGNLDDVFALAGGTYDPIRVNGQAGTDRVNFNGAATMGESTFTAESATVTGAIQPNALSLFVDDLAINNTIATASADGITIAPQTPTRPVSLGAEVAGSLSITAAEFALISTNVDQNFPQLPLNIGVVGGSGGPMTISAAMTSAGVSTLNLFANGDVVETGSGSLAVNRLTVTANQGIGLGGSNTVTVLEAFASIGLDFNNGSAPLQVGPGGLSTQTDNLTVSAGSLTFAGTVTNLDETGATISLKADNMAITQAIDAGTGKVILAPKTLFRAVNLGTATGALDLTAAELDFITAKTLSIGGVGTGSIGINVALAPANVTGLSLIAASGGISTSGAGKITVANLRTQSVGPTTLTGANDVDRLAALVTGNTATDTFSFTDIDALAIDTVDGASGITTNTSVAGISTTLKAGATIQAAGANLIGHHLILDGTGPFTLTNPGNQMLGIQGIVNGAVSYTDANDLNIPSLNGQKLSSLGNPLAVNTVAGDINLPPLNSGSEMTAGDSTLTLTAGGAGSQITVQANASISAGTGGMTLTADKMVIDGGLDVGDHSVTLRPLTAGRSINFGVADSSFSLGLSAAKVNHVTAGRLIIGSGTSGGITFSEQIAPTQTSFLSLRTGQGFASNIGGEAIVVAKLTLESSTGIFGALGIPSAIPLTISVQQLEARSSGTVKLQNTNAVQIGGIDSGLTGLSTDDDFIELTAGGTISLAEAGGFSVSGRDVTLVASGANSDVQSIVNALAIQATGGDIDITAGRDIVFGAGGANFDNDVLADDDIVFTAGRDITLAGQTALAADEFGNLTQGGLRLTTGAGGTFLTSAAGTDALRSFTGNIAVSADRILINPGSGITTGNGAVFLSAVTPGRDVDLGSATDAAANVALSSAELARISARRIDVIGGNINFSAPVALGASSDLELRADGAITNSFVGTAFTGGSLTILRGSLQPGGTSVGNFAVVGNFAFDPDSIFNPTLAGTEPGESDQLVVTGTIDLGGATLQAGASYAAAPGDLIQVIDNDSTDATIGTFAGLAQGTVLETGEEFFQVNYAGGSGNDGVLKNLVAVAPTFSKNLKAATYIDEDGDLVTVKTTKGTFTTDNFIFRPTGDGGRQQLRTLDLTATPADFTNTNISVTAKLVAKVGNKQANVGFVNAAGKTLGTVTIAGDLGQLDAASSKGLTVGSIGSFGLTTQAFGGSLTSDIAGNLTKLTVKANFVDATVLAGGSIGPVKVGGSIFGGKIAAGTSLGAVSVKDNITGTEAAPVVISAFGKEIAPAKGKDVAIASLKVGGSVDSLRLLAGYDTSGVAKNSDASIGAITIGGGWLASTALAGVEAAGDGFDGTGDDRAILGGTRNNAAIVSQIAAITIKGQAIGTAGSATDNFGIVAEQIASAKIGTTRFTFAKGPRSPGDVFAIGANVSPVLGETSDFTIREATL